MIQPSKPIDRSIWLITQVAASLSELGRCVRAAGRPAEAVEYFRKAVEIEEVKLGAADMRLSVTQHKLGQSLREALQPKEGMGCNVY